VSKFASNRTARRKRSRASSVIGCDARDRNTTFVSRLLASSITLSPGVNPLCREEPLEEWGIVSIWGAHKYCAVESSRVKIAIGSEICSEV